VVRWIQTPRELAALVSSLGGCRALALDTESDSLHHHIEKVCLIQLATDKGEACLIDPLAVPELSPLGVVLADPAVVKVLHGADYDVTTLKRDFSFAFASLFDTMIAARFLGLPEIGLQALARAELGVALSKESQKDDWSRRPLNPQQEEYALADVQHLLALRERLAERLRGLGRLDWVGEECAAVAALPPARRGPESEAYLRIKGARRLPPRRLAVLRELVAWREARAASTDIPAFKILGNETLLTLAEKAPRTPAALGEVRGVLPRLRDQAGALLAAVGRALELPEAELVVLPPAPRPLVPEDVRRRVERLKAWRAREAARVQLDVSVVLPQRLIDRLAEAAPRETADLAAVAGLRRWRIETYGPELVSALRS
jgi:ribonuclease D